MGDVAWGRLLRHLRIYRCLKTTSHGLWDAPEAIFFELPRQWYIQSRRYDRVVHIKCNIRPAQ